MNKISILFLCLLIISCSQTEEQKYNHLCEVVLNHYRKDQNPLKLKAASFLLDNMKGKYSIEGELYKVYTDTIKKYYRDPNILFKKLKLLKKYSYNMNRINDTNIITTDYLIQNIDNAFDIWEKAKWKNDVSFNDFCEFVLPYRIGREPLEDWRRKIRENSLLRSYNDTLSSFADVQSAACWLVRKQSELKKNFLLKWGGDAPNVPDLQYSILNLLSTGSCLDLTQYSLFVCRSAGIPVAHDFTPHWANDNMGHDWAAILTNSELIAYNLPVIDTFRNNIIPGRLPSKVYRHMFSAHANSHFNIRGYCDFLPPYFNNPCLTDVTTQYLQTCNVKVPVLTNVDNEKLAYLTVSNRKDWVPVGWGEIKRINIANFQEVGINSVYLPVFKNEGGTQPLNYPFIINKNGELRYLKPDLENLQTIELLRKKPLTVSIQKYIDSMIGGRFQASDNKDFKNAVTLYSIKESPGVYYNNVVVKKLVKYRYVRYIGKDSSKCNVAEIEFFDKGEKIPLKGKFIGTKGYRKIENAFDGNLLTFYSANEEPNKWIGLDLGKPIEISKIRFASRNDQNHIVVGDRYELYYWNDEWKSLGVKTANSSKLVYDNVPSNSLFLLINISEGKEDRIFTYENGKQIWW
jgi:hypothetical protein